MKQPTRSAGERLIASAFFFDFAVPCYYLDPIWLAAEFVLDERYRLPTFSAWDDSAASKTEEWADLRMAWSKDGLTFQLRVHDKKNPPWCRDTRLTDSDGMAVWIDTRNTPGIHRANRFCHQFRFLPAGGGKKYDAPVARQLVIDRAREGPTQLEPDALKIRSQKRVDGYLLQAHIPAAALSGFEPEEHPQLGFTFAVQDRELGEHTLTLGGEFPYQSDPSLWSTLELIRP